MRNKKSPTESYSIVFVTAPSLKEAKKLARELLKAKLVACVNIIKDVHSFFWWQGKVDAAFEALLVIKTKKRLFAPVCRLVTKLHSYDVPEIIAFPLINIARPYRRWLNASILKSL